MRTKVTAHLNGAYVDHLFDMDKVTFMQKWNNHIAGIGYFEHVNTNGVTVIINPSNCALIEIEEVSY